MFGIRRTIHGISFEFTYSRALSGSNAAPPHSAPPSNPGNTMMPRSVGGANMPVPNERKRSSTAAWASGVRRVSIASVSPWRANGGGASG